MKTPLNALVIDDDFVTRKQRDRLDRKTVCDSTSLQYELLQFLMDWLMNHTKDVDKKYGPFLNSKGVY
jgi:hemerythrin